MSESNKPSKQTIIVLMVSFLLGVLIMAAIGALLLNIEHRKKERLEYPLKIVEIDQNELDPAVWGRNFPRQYDSFQKTQNDTVRTPFGGSVPFSKIDENPAMKRIWAGYSFSEDHNEERGHYYALIDQTKTKRVTEHKQPGACANCHAAEAPQLIQKMGWEKFNRTPYDELKPELHRSTSCADCHDPKTMELRITRPAFKKAMEERGIDLSKATRQEMRTYVCAQCHVEYYFKGDDKVLTFPWKNGFNIDDIDAYYEEREFKDWVHAETGAPMIKIQHPEFETWSSGIHAKSGVSCADCHMPYVREGAVKVSDHWVRSPLTNIQKSCMTCHHQTEKDLEERIITIQNKTSELLRSTEIALVAAIDAIKAAKEAGASDQDLEEARKFHRRASMRWDFVSSENSTGFHSSQESARNLANAIDYARQAQLAAERVLAKIKERKI